MVAVPPDTPVTIPVPKLMAATAVLLLLHVPPPASLKAVVDPAQRIAVPVIADGVRLTVTTVVVRQPVPSL